MKRATFVALVFFQSLLLAKTETRQVARYKDVPVYANQCTYDTYRWTHTSVRANRGTLQSLPQNPMSWPDVGNIGNLSRATKRPPVYSLTFGYTRNDKASSQSKEVDQETFAKWNVGDKANLRIRKRTGNLVDFSPLPQKAE